MLWLPAKAYLQSLGATEANTALDGTRLLFPHLDVEGRDQMAAPLRQPRLRRMWYALGRGFSIIAAAIIQCGRTRRPRKRKWFGGNLGREAMAGKLSKAICVAKKRQPWPRNLICAAQRRIKPAPVTSVAIKTPTTRLTWTVIWCAVKPTRRNVVLRPAAPKGLRMQACSMARVVCAAIVTANSAKRTTAI